VRGLRSAARRLRPVPYTLDSTPHTLHPTPYTPHPTPYILHPTPHTLHPAPHTLHPTPHTLHPTLYTIKHTPGGGAALHCKTVPSSSLLLSGLELSDTTIYEPYIRALLETAPHFCRAVVRVRENREHLQTSSKPLHISDRPTKPSGGGALCCQTVRFRAKRGTP